MSDESSEPVNENQNRLAEARLAEARLAEARLAEARLGEARLATQEEQITKPAPKAEPQREKDPKKVAAGKKLAEKNRQASWLPEMSFQTVLSIVGMTFTAFELYQRFCQKESYGGGIKMPNTTVSKVRFPK